MPDNIINILLVEDDEVDIMNIKRAFVKNKVINPLHVAGNGVEALKYLTDLLENGEPLPRIILLDLNMPQMGGIEFLAKLRKSEGLSDISVFVMTTSNEEKDKMEAYKLNVAGYIVKPLSMDQFINAVSTLKSYWSLCEYPKGLGD
ncbi:MAG: response regulator [Sphingobacteriia bacterium]|jgi:CheY-like chemotaxis protein|nr:response regulator [Sphingobacteriia bacterium]